MNIPLGTVRQCEVANVIQEPKFTALVCLEIGAPEQGYICLFRPFEVTAEVGDKGTQTLVSALDGHSFWQFARRPD